MQNIPKILTEDGNAVFFHENENCKQAFGEDARVVRILNGRRTHNVSRTGNVIWWENNESAEGDYEFPTDYEAAAWWDSRFKKCWAMP